MGYPQLHKGKECCGCSACKQICHNDAISMQMDSEGFCYPILEKRKCIQCNLCEKVCPCRKQNEEKIPLKTFAAINKNESIRIQSSSGGVFTLLAEKIIDKGGCVFAARFDSNWEVKHDVTFKKDDLCYFRGSKYVQSSIGNCYKLAQTFLEEGIYVLFVGTPCQIAGLNSFLSKKYDNLFLIDFICHGVPSPLVWSSYLHSVAKQFYKKDIFYRISHLFRPKFPFSHIEFRNKKLGWKNFGISLKWEKGQKEIWEYHFNNSYMSCFLNNLDLRPSCHYCRLKSGKSQSDITIADFWNVDKVIDNFDDDKGTSLVLINTTKGYNLFKELDCKSQEVDFHSAIQYNMAWQTSYEAHDDREKFFSKYTNYGVFNLFNR